MGKNIEMKSLLLKSSQSERKLQKNTNISTKSYGGVNDRSLLLVESSFVTDQYKLCLEKTIH